MLASMYIKGLAVIEELSIEFSSQLNVITGETGAGKSILIRALSLILGGKGTSEVVRSGREQAVVTAVFSLTPEHKVHQLLLEHKLSPGEDQGELILRRHISCKGRSQAWVNDVPVTLAIMRQVGEHLIDIFGQHDNHKLLSASNHSYYLDQFVSPNSLSASYQDLYQRVQVSLRSFKESLRAYETRLRDLDYLEFRKAELDELSPSVEDYREQKQYLDDSKGSFALVSALRQVESLVDRAYKGRPLSHALQEIIANLSQVAKESPLLEQAHVLEDQLNQYSFDIGRELSRHNIDEGVLDASKARLDAYHQIFHKLNVKNIEDLCQSYEGITRDIHLVESFANKVEEGLESLLNMSRELSVLGRKLRHGRKSAFKKIQKHIRAELQELNMKGADLFLQLQDHELHFPSEEWTCLNEEQSKVWGEILDELSLCGSDGIDRLQFLLRSNPGEEPKPLSKIASGGEVSRIMLGIKKVLSEGAQTCVMVFDEIDTGISGQTAHVVGKKLADISKGFQVICISHLPQVAVYGNSHFQVSKSIISGRAESKITRMNKDQCIKEVARLLSSGKITPSSIKNAKELLREARQSVDV